MIAETAAAIRVRSEEVRSWEKNIGAEPEPSELDSVIAEKWLHIANCILTYVLAVYTTLATELERDIFRPTFDTDWLRRRGKRPSNCPYKPNCPVVDLGAHCFPENSYSQPLIMSQEWMCERHGGDDPCEADILVFPQIGLVSKGNATVSLNGIKLENHEMGRVMSHRALFYRDDFNRLVNLVMYTKELRKWFGVSTDHQAARYTGLIFAYEELGQIMSMIKESNRDPTLFFGRGLYTHYWPDCMPLHCYVTTRPSVYYNALVVFENEGNTAFRPWMTPLSCDVIRKGIYLVPIHKGAELAINTPLSAGIDITNVESALLAVNEPAALSSGIRSYGAECYSYYWTCLGRSRQIMVHPEYDVHPGIVDADFEGDIRIGVIQRVRGCTDLFNIPERTVRAQLVLSNQEYFRCVTSVWLRSSKSCPTPIRQMICKRSARALSGYSSSMF